MNEEMIKFYGKIRGVAESSVVTIPKTVVMFGDFNKGDQVELYIRKNKKEMQKFYGKIWNINESFIITIPISIMNFGTFKKGDQVELDIRKKVIE